MIWPRLLPNFRAAAETIPFHDARIEQLLVLPAREAHLQLFCETSVGKSRVKLRFEDSTIWPPLEALRRLVLSDRAVLIETEMDVKDGGRFELRFIFVPEGELGIEFGDLSFEKIALAASDGRQRPVFQVAEVE